MEAKNDMCPICTNRIKPDDVVIEYRFGADEEKVGKGPFLGHFNCVARLSQLK
jgi:hypothetical protein